MHVLSRRELLRFALGCTAACGSGPVFAATPGDGAAAPLLTSMLRHPLLVRSLYRIGVSRNYAEDGAAGSNRNGYQWIEEQRQGAEWMVRGYAEDRAEWRQLGWQQLDWGLARQQGDGGFGSKDPFHSTSFFVEALARSCLIDPAGATPRRRDGLARGAQWLMSPAAEESGVPRNRPFTHRRYILAAAFGQAGRVTGEPRFARKAAEWAHEGLASQQSDGTNPEKGGFDAGYQMVGVLMALRYLPVCDDSGLRAGLRAMIRKAVPPELARLRADGSIDPEGSTRIEKERTRGGQVKDVPYGEIMQALVYAALALPQPAWLEPAERIALARKWLRG